MVMSTSKSTLSANRILRISRSARRLHSTREHLLAPGGKTCVITNAIKRLQNVLTTTTKNYTEHVVFDVRPQKE
jgi:hypothetical protein